MKRLKSLSAALAVCGAALLGAQQTQAAIIADIVWVVDTSGSMGGDISQVKQRITEFDAVMLANGIDARYGLVRFGGAASLIQDITSFSDFTRAGGPFQNLTANGGGTEDGSAALQTSLGASFRNDAVRNLILVTDEDDDVSANRAALQAALDATAIDELVNIIGNPGDDSNNYYRNLAPANGGKFFNILDFRSNPAPFFTNFVETKVVEIVDDFCKRFPTDPQCVKTVSTTGTLPLVALAIAGLVAIRRRR
jgi:MYXO-CTERM domain-containing protein